MKNLILIAIALFSFKAYSQEELYIIHESEQIPDLRTQLEKEDSNDFYNQSQITTLDLIEALELASVGIHKFKLGEFEKEYKFQIFADEYVNGKLTKTDTLLDYKNDYGYYVDGDFKQGFIDQLKIFTKTDDNQCELKITTYALGTKKEISLEKVDDRQFYKWREYEETSWKLNQKVPLLIFASSWLDKDYDFHRFCGVVKLKENDERTNELLNYSPNFILINYMISEIEE